MTKKSDDWADQVLRRVCVVGAISGSVGLAGGYFLHAYDPQLSEWVGIACLVVIAGIFATIIVRVG